VLRFWNHDVLSNLDGVLTAVLEILHNRNRARTLKSSKNGTSEIAR
jgi:very-short-patch-repair endonuclease